MQYIRHIHICIAANITNTTGHTAQTKGTTIHNENLTAKQLDAIIREYAADIEIAWANEPPAEPSPDRQPIESAQEKDLDVTEFEYAAAVRFLLEDLGAEHGFTGAREMVLDNRVSLSNARDIGSEPDVVADAVLGVYA